MNPSLAYQQTHDMLTWNKPTITKSKQIINKTTKNQKHEANIDSKNNDEESQIKLFHGGFRGERLGINSIVNSWPRGGLGCGRTTDEEIHTNHVIELIVG